MTKPALRECLLVADLHLNDNPQDEYRWGLFEWLCAQIADYGVREVCILGDLTDSKDRHSAKLVNRLVDELTRIKRHVVIIKGNHDFIDPANPFFGFAQHLPNVDYYVEPGISKFGRVDTLFLPHSSQPEVDWQDLFLDPPVAEVAMAHLTVKNAIGDNRQPLLGIPSKLVKALRMPVFSGDVHVPQTIANVEYLGAPYAIKFGDNPGRSAIVFDPLGKRHELKFPAPRKRILKIEGVDDLAKLRVNNGDMVQFQISLAVDQIAEAPVVRAAIDQFVAKRQLQLAGSEMVLHFSASEAELQLLPDVSMSAAFDSYGKLHGISEDLMAVGRELLKKASRLLATE